MQPVMMEGYRHSCQSAACCRRSCTCISPERSDLTSLVQGRTILRMTSFVGGFSPGCDTLLRQLRTEQLPPLH